MPLGAPNRLYKHARVRMCVAEIVPAAVTPVRLLHKNFMCAWHTSNLHTHATLLCDRDGKNLLLCFESALRLARTAVLGVTRDLH